MKKRRTKEEINDITVFAREVGLDGRIAKLCQYRYQVLRLFELQKTMNDKCTIYFHLKHAVSKERIKEYEAAIKHKELLAGYLYDSGQLEALAALRKVEIRENEPKVQDFIARNKQYIREEAEEMSISKSNIKEIVKFLMKYLQGKHQSEYIEFESGSLYKQTQKYLAEGNHIQFIESKNK